MLFNSLPFLAFFPVFLALYFGTRGRTRLVICLIGSYVFYGWWDWRFLGLILLSTVIDYSIGRRLALTQEVRKRRMLLTVSIVANLSILGFFKYFDFFVGSFVTAMDSLGMSVSTTTLDIILPVGISFYTFQTMSYTFDVYRRHLDVERDPLRFATYVAFFPQLVAGPIVRAGKLLPQLRRDHPFDWDRVLSGFALVVWGFFKKVVVADTLAIIVDKRFAFPEAHNSTSLTIGIFFYAFQIYADFSGYSDIAIGCGRMLGFDFGVNFNKPYFSRSFSEFWERWHISLSSWLRDYLYIPLGGNRTGRLKTYRNVTLTMLLGGLWHGANWTFVLWGALHGGYLVLERVFSGPWRRAREALGVPALAAGVLEMMTVFSLTCLAWVFFRAPSTDHAFAFIARIATSEFSLAGVPGKFLILKGAVAIGLLLIGELLTESDRVARWVGKPGPVLLGLCALGLWTVALFGSFEGAQFIYFQF